ncbi:MAG: hypothetical protein CL424_00215 [Acidimicrobiaceae bacterium]|nr:hypothetical protein [Acidimicrobiaceae bacterium]
MFRHGQRHDESAIRYQLHERLISIGDDYWIENERGQRAFKVDGKALRLRDTWKLEDPSGHEVAVIRERKLSIRDAIKIDVGGTEATVKKALIGLRDRFHIEVDGGEDLEAHGNIVDHEYEIERDGETVARVSKRWFRVRDTYGIEVQRLVDGPLALAVTVAIDALAHDRG